MFPDEIENKNKGSGDIDMTSPGSETVPVGHSTAANGNPDAKTNGRNNVVEEDAQQLEQRSDEQQTFSNQDAAITTVPATHQEGGPPLPPGQREFSQMEHDIVAKHQGRGSSVTDSLPGAHAVSNFVSAPTPNGGAGSGGEGAGLSNLERDVLAKRQGKRPSSSRTPSTPGAFHEGPTSSRSGQNQLTQLEIDVAAKNGARHTSILVSRPGAHASQEPSPNGRGNLAIIESDVMAKNRARPSNHSIGTSLPGAYSEVPPLSSPSSGRKQLGQLESDVEAKNLARHITDLSVPGAHHVPNNNNVSSTGRAQLSQLESDIAAKNRARPNPVASGGSRNQLSQLEQDVTAKQRAGARTTEVPGAHPVVGCNQLFQLEKDVTAKQKAGAGAGTPGAVQVSGAYPVGCQSQLSQLEQDVAAKQRAGSRTAGTSGMPGSHQIGTQSQLSQLEQDITAKQRVTTSTPGAAQVAGAYPVGGQTQLSQLEQDVTAKQKAGASSNGSTPGATQVPGAYPIGAGTQLSQLEQDVTAKQKAAAGRTGAAQVPGAHPVGTQTQLSQLEQDVSTKQRAGGRKAGTHLSQLEKDVAAKQRAAADTSGASQVPGAHPAGGRTQLSRLEQDVAAKQQAKSSALAATTQRAHAGGRTRLSQLESDVAAKNKARPISTMSTAGAHPAFVSPSIEGRSELSVLESDVMAKNRAQSDAQNVDVRGAAGLNSFEQDVMSKNQARRSRTSNGTALTMPGAHPATNNAGGLTDLTSLASDVMAKNHAMPQPSVPCSTSVLNSLEQDVIAKNQARSELVSSVQSSVHGELAVEEEDVIAKNKARAELESARSPGQAVLSNLERDVAAKNWARPPPLMTPTRSNDLYSLENVVARKASLGQDGSHALPSHYSEEATPLFSAVGHNPPSHSSRFMHEISSLDERISQKTGIVPQQTQPQYQYQQQQHHQLNLNDREYFDDYDQYQPASGCMDSDYGKPASNINNSDKIDFNDSDSDGLVGVERARADKEFIDNTPGADDVGEVPFTPGDMEYGEMQGGDLAIATAIEEDDDDYFIPAAVEYDPDAKPPLYKNRRCRLYGFVGICFIFAVVAVAAVVTQVSKGEEALIGPTNAPTSFRESLGIEQQIAEVFGTDYFEDINSIQYKALNWLINKDPYQIEPDAENLIQRFIMVFFYMVTSQNGPWLSCNPPTGTQRESCFYSILVDTLSDPWQYNEIYWTRWLTGLNECQWAGVTCHSGKVTDILLDGYHLTGSFPTELVRLDYLRDVSLTHNELGGTLPTELANMKHLTDIELQYNVFTGSIPLEWFGAKNLIHVNIGGNRLGGTLPSEFGRLTDLQRLFLHNNAFTGALPVELFSLTSLKWLFIGKNRLTGSIPSEIGELSNVEYLYMDGNLLTGSLPTEMGSLTELRELDIHDTLISGSLPDEFFTGLGEYLNVLDLSSSQFSGTLTTQLGSLSTVDWLLISDNQFTGTIPSEVGRMRSLNRLQINGNFLTGTVPQELCFLRGENALRDLKVDCSTTSSGKIPVFCPAGCCTECCNQDTDVCLPAA